MSLRKQIVCTIFTVIILIYSTPTLATPDAPMYDPPSGTTPATLTKTVFIKAPVNVFDAAAIVPVGERILDLAELQLNPLEGSAGLWSLVNFEAIPNVMASIVSAMLGGDITEVILKLVSASSSSREEARRIIAS